MSGLEGPESTSGAFSAEDVEHAVRLVSGLAYGRDRTCGNKLDYPCLEAAQEAAVGGRFGFEGYPCAWCLGYHVGKRMDDAEMASWVEVVLLLRIAPVTLLNPRPAGGATPMGD